MVHRSAAYFIICINETNGTNVTNRQIVFARISIVVIASLIQIVANGRQLQVTDYFSICANGAIGASWQVPFEQFSGVNEEHFTNCIPIDWGAFQSFQLSDGLEYFDETYLFVLTEHVWKNCFGLHVPM